MLRSVIAQSSKEYIQQAFNLLNGEYLGMKDVILSRFIPDYSLEEKEEIWKQVTEVYNDILMPFIEAVYQIQVNYNTTENKRIGNYPTFGKEDSNSMLAPKVTQQAGIGQDILALSRANSAYQNAQVNRNEHQAQLCKSSVICCPKPFEINFIRLQAPNDVATIHCKIFSESIPYAVIDTGSDSSIISSNIVKTLGLKIDKNTSHEISGIASLAKTIGTIFNLPITIGTGKNELSITDDFLVVETEMDKNGNDKSLLILGVPWQHKAGWSPIINGEFTANCNGKVITIPLSIHKKTRENFIINDDDEKIKKKK